MSYGIKIEVWGDFACFTRPEMKVERVSYDVITPSAARAIIEAVYWKPAIQWRIDKIHCINEIQFINIKRNEVSSIASFGKPFIDVTQKRQRQQRFSMILKDVKYVIEAHFEITDKAGDEDTVEKHISIVKRRISQGQTFSQPYFGCREFAANFRLLKDDEQLPKGHYENCEKDFGFMLYDIDFKNDKQAHFFKAVMKNGVIDTRQGEVFK